MGWEGGKRRGDEGRREVIGSDCVCVCFLLVQPREEQGLGVGEEKDEESVLYNGCDEKRELIPSTDVLFISHQYSIVIAVDLIPSMLQVVSLELFCYITILSHLLLIFSVFFILFLSYRATRHFKSSLTLLSTLCACAYNTWHNQ